MDEYKVLGPIGEGAHGYVVKARSISRNVDVALKKLLLKSLNDGIPNNILREIKALQQADSEYVVELLEVIPHDAGFVLVMEYLPLGLNDVIKNIRKPLTESQIKKYMKMLLSGIAYMHGIGIMHRDIKPANLLVSSEGVLKIADLGLARLYCPEDKQRQYSHQVVTRWYRAPELLYGSRNYTPAIDIWSVGCVFGEMLNRSPLFPGESDIEQLAIVLRKLGTPTLDIWPDLKTLPDYNKITFPNYPPAQWDRILPDVESNSIDFIKTFLRYNDSKRITAQEALINQYFFIKPLESDMSDMPKPSDIEGNSYYYPSKVNFNDLCALINGIEK